jgi:hypothetical protein
MDIGNYFGYQTYASVDMIPTNANASVNEGIPLNMIEEMNRHDTEDVTAEYNLRTQLYENKDIFFNNENNIDETTNTDILELKEVVKKGQEMLKKEILRYSTLKDHLDEMTNLQMGFHNQIMAIKKSLLLLGELHIDVAEYSNDIDHIQKSLDMFDTKVCSHITNQSSHLREEYTDSFNKLAQLKDVYKILKNSDVTFACPICLTRQVESFLTPCGHTYCSKCLEDIRQRCYICRQNIDRVRSLYFN